MAVQIYLDKIDKLQKFGFQQTTMQRLALQNNV